MRPEVDAIIELRVLLLEDSPLDVDLITDWLNSDGFECHVECVQTRDEFARALREGEFDVLLSDYSLPGFDGISALDMACQLRPQLPFIFVSGHLGEELAIETLKRGATDYVLKDRLERLVPSIKRALREEKERSERRRIEDTLQVLSQASLVLSSLDYSTTLLHVARLAVPHFADYCIVDLLSEDASGSAADSAGAIQRVAVAHADAAQEPLAQELLQHPPRMQTGHPITQVVELRRSLLISEIPASFVESHTRDECHLQIIQKLGIASCMLVPLLSEGQTLGVMTFVSASDKRRFNALDLSLAEDLARRCALAVDKARLHRKTLDALRGRDEFLAVLSHELRSPLTSILGWVHLLQSENLDDQTRAHGLEVIERNTKTQAQLIEDLLEVSRIITGRLKLDMAPVALAEVIENVINSLTPTWQSKEIHVEFNNEAAASRVLGDGPRLQQVVWNLVSNAIKFTPRDGRIDIFLRESDEQVQIIVKDNGQGIAREFVPYVFDRFRQADSSSTRNHGGLGLGLAIVRHLSEIHGGSVQAHSDGEGLGSTFVVGLPLMSNATLQNVKNSEEDERVRPNQDIPDSTLLEGLKVLVVEDGDDARELLTAILRRSGALVTSVASAQAAMNAIEESVPDVLLSDIGMPGEDGYALMRRVTEWEENHQKRIPAVALTAYAGEQDRLRVRAAGFGAHLSKPVEPAHLVAVIADFASCQNTSLS